jgi:copper chaperone CopZ
MRTVLGLLTALALAAGCQKDASPEAPAATPTAAPTAAAPTTAALPAATAPVAAMGDHASCGGSCGGMCGNQACGGSCGGGAEVATPVAPSDAQWTALHVAGMHCGGCVKRVKNALAKVDGVLGVEVDLGKAEVRVATAKGSDARAIASAPISALGYQVLAN